MHLRPLIVLSVLLAGLALAPAAHALAPGDPIPGFTTLDRQLIPTSSTSSITAVAYQPDGKIVASFGYFNEGLGIARFHADGTLDTTFATGGVFYQQTSLYDVAQAIAVDAQGRIVFAGKQEHDTDADPGRIMVGRLTAAGALDATFGTGGIVRYIPPTSPPPTITDANVTNVFVHTSGSIYVAGSMLVSGDEDFFAAKVTSSGVFDTTYSADGVATNGTTSDEAAADALLLPDGRVVVLGTRAGASDPNRGALLGVFGADGSIGPQTFDVGRGSDPHGDPEPWSFTTGVVTGPSTVRIVEHRAATPYPLVSVRMVQYTITGNAAALDTSFDGDGFGPDLSVRMHPTDMFRAADGKFVLVGYDERDAYALRLARVSSSGASLDTTFATEGIRTFGVHDPQASYNPYAIEGADGSVLVAGNHRIESPYAHNLYLTKVAGRIARVSTSIAASPAAPKLGSTVQVDVRVEAAGPDAAGAITTTVTIPSNLRATAPAGCVPATPTSWTCTSTASATFSFLATATVAQTDTIGATATSSVFDDDRANDSSTASVTSTKRTVTAALLQLTKNKKGKLVTSTCGATVKRSCIALRVRPRVRLAAFQLRAAVAPTGERVPAKATVSVQKLVKGKWVALKLTGKLGAVAIGKGNLGTWTLPRSIRTKAAQLRVRVAVAEGAATTATSSAWRYVRVR